MGAFVDRNETKVIRDETWETWEEMTIGHASAGEKDLMRARLLAIAKLAGDVSEATLTAARWPVVLAHLRAWTLTANGEPPDKDNRPLDIKPETVQELDPAYAEYAYAAINEFTRGEVKEQSDAFFRGIGRSLPG
jgi:hypothetical protein